MTDPCDCLGHFAQGREVDGALFPGPSLLPQNPDHHLLLGLEPPASFVGLTLPGLSLVGQKLLVSLVRLQLVAVFQENPLVFEHVPFPFPCRLWSARRSMFYSQYLLSSRRGILTLLTQVTSPGPRAVAAPLRRHLPSCSPRCFSGTEPGNRQSQASE